MKLDFDPYCPRCRRIHAPGKHRARPSKQAQVAGSSPAVADVASRKPGLASKGARAPKAVGANRGGIVQNVAQQAEQRPPKQDDKPTYEELLAAAEKRKAQVREAVRRYRAKKGKL